MGRVHVTVPTPALALRRAEAAAALAVSVDTFDAEVRHELPTVRAGGCVLYPVTALEQWLAARTEPPIATQIKRNAA